MARPETTIYHNDCIVGRVGEDLTPELFHVWGRSLARLAANTDNIVVGCDGRESSCIYKKALMEGLNDAGVDLIDLGEIPKVAVYYARRRLQADGGAYVSGNGMSYDYNGLTWHLDKSPLPFAEQIQSVRNETETAPPTSDIKRRGTVRTSNFLSDWIEWHHGIWYDTPPTPFRVVLDPLNSVWAGLLRKMCQIIFPHMLFEAIHDKADGQFCGHDPSCRNQDSVRHLGTEVDIRRAHMGFAIDADTDCFTLVDDHGTPFSTYELSWLMLQSLNGGVQGEKIVHTEIFPQLFANAVRRLGGKLVRAPMQGEAFVETMKKTEATFGFDHGGRYCSRGTTGQYISFFAICWLLDYWARQRPLVPLSVLRKSFPVCCASQELTVPWNDPKDVVKKLAAKWNTSPYETEDGIQFSGPNGRVHLREIRDNVQLGLFFEATDRRMLNQMVVETASVLDDIDGSGSVLLDRYRDDIGSRYHLNW